MKIIASIAVLGLLALGACETEPRQTLHPSFGNAVRHNMAVHIINPEAGRGETTAPDHSGLRNAGSMDRYHRNDVLVPEAPRTSEVGDGGGE